MLFLNPIFKRKIIYQKNDINKKSTILFEKCNMNCITELFENTLCLLHVHHYK